jgi:hypothetical protein
MSKIEFPAMNPRDRTKQALIMPKEAVEAYMVEVIAKSHHYRQQVIACRF